MAFDMLHQHDAGPALLLVPAIYSACTGDAVAWLPCLVCWSEQLCASYTWRATACHGKYAGSALLYETIHAELLCTHYVDASVDVV